MAKSSGKFQFKRGDILGAADAENDSAFLDKCFVDTGDLNTLLDTTSQRCIVVGRTGSGKSALLLQIEKKASGHTERVSPESLSMNYIANSDTVRVLLSLGVNIDPFFKLLWRQVLAIQILQHIHPVESNEKSSGIVAWLKRIIRFDKTTPEKKARHQRVLDFLDKHGAANFWSDVGPRVQGIVSKFETEIEKSLGRNAELGVEAGNSVLGGSASIGNTRSQSSRNKMNVEITTENRNRFQSVIHELHARDLDSILDLVSEVLEDAGQNIYIVIDKLDLQWADESIRYRLIRALVDTAITFTRVPRAKVILAMRVDLIERVYRDARHEAGTQSEKLKDYYLTLFWDHKSLTGMLDERVNKLISDRYVSSYKVSHRDVLNPKLRRGRQAGKSTIEFMLDRTWNRPRDLIDFFNACIERSTGKPKISDDSLLEAEGEYSRNRLQSMAEEWQLEYPHLHETIVRVLGKRDTRIRVADISDETVISWVSLINGMPIREGDRLRPLATSIENCERDCDSCRVELSAIFYKVGAVGVQNDNGEKPQWATNLSYSISSSEIGQDSFLYIHPGLWKALGVAMPS